MRPLFIFDLDGTLALNEHRQHLVQGEHKDWKAFYAACDKDVPNIPVIEMMRVLIDAGCNLMIWSGRSNEVMDKTSDWLEKHVFLGDHGPDETILQLQMRKEGDLTPDEELKLKWLNELSPTLRRSLVAIFDDRDKVVKMWRDNGVACFQVAPGAF